MAKEETAVEPLEAADEAPAKKSKGELCWNCTNQGDSNALDAKGNCEVCGFQKSLLYNGDIEAAAAAKRKAEAEAAFNKGVLGK